MGKNYFPDKFCHKCQDTKLAEEFSANRARADGLAQWCKPCTKAYMEQRDQSGFAWQRKKKPIKKNLQLKDQSASVKAIVACLIEDPKSSCESISIKVGLQPSTIRGYMSGNDFLRALRTMGSEKITQLIPEALGALHESLSSKSDIVKLKAATEVLENENVIGPKKIDITLNDLSHKSNKELEDMLNGGFVPPAQSIEAEVIS